MMLAHLLINLLIDYLIHLIQRLLMELIISMVDEINSSMSFEGVIGSLGVIPPKRRAGVLMHFSPISFYCSLL